MSTAIVRRLDAAHDMTFGRGMRNIAGGAEGAAQRVRCRLLTMLGEWFLNTDAGVPWWQDSTSVVQPILGGPRDLLYAESVLKQAILLTDGVASIVAFTMTTVSATRRLNVSCTALTVDGDVFTIQGVGP